MIECRHIVPVSAEYCTSAEAVVGEAVKSGSPRDKKIKKTNTKPTKQAFSRLTSFERFLIL
jgi:hypothetical protein